MLPVLICLLFHVYGVFSESFLVLTNTTLVSYDTTTAQLKECQLDEGTVVPMSLDYHYEKGYLYYVTYKEDPSYQYFRFSILHRRKVDLKNCNESKEFVLQNDNDLPIQQVVVDWVHDHIYWRNDDKVMRANLDLSERRKLFDRTDLKSGAPFGFLRSSDFYKILIDPYVRMLFLICNSRNLDQSKQESQVITTDLSGGNWMRYADLVPVNSTVEIDIHNRRLYFTNMDTGEIGMFNYDENGITGSDLSISPWSGLNETQQYLMFGVAGNNIYSLVGDDVFKIRINAGSGKRKEQLNKLGLPMSFLRRIKHVEKEKNCLSTKPPFTSCYEEYSSKKLFESQTKTGENPCKTNDCSYHNCLFSDAAVRGKVVKTCQGANNTILVSGTNSSVSFVDTATNRSLTCRGLYSLPLQSLDYHYTKGYFYYITHVANESEITSRIMRRTIPFNCRDKPALLVKSPRAQHKSKSKGTNLEISPTNISDERSIIFHQVVVDWVNDKLYWISNATVVMGDLNARNSKHVVNTTQLRQFANLPASVQLQQLVIDPYNRLMFLTANDDRPASMIITLDLTGDNLKLHETVSVPRSSIVVDLHNKRLYFHNKKTGEIRMYKYDNSQLKKSALSLSPWSDSYDDQKHFLIDVDNSSIYTREDENVYRISWNAFGDLTKDRIYTFSDIVEKTKIFPRQTDLGILLQNSVARKDCRLPEYQHNSYSQFSCPTCKQTAGDTVSENQLIIVSCAPGTQMITGYNSFATTAYISCYNGLWEPSIPQCYKLCPPLTSLTLDLECWQGPNPVTCNQPMLPDTTVKFKCKQYYESSFEGRLTGMNCLSSGTWSRQLPGCTPKCGESNLNSVRITPQIAGGNVSEAGNFPWATGLFHNTSGRWEAKCGGTLISTTAVLTAAHCVTQDALKFTSPVMKAKDVAIAMGKLKRDWYISEVSETKRYVKAIHVHPNYAGSPQNYGQDIAILILDREVSVNRFVMPACVDYKQKYVSRLTASGGGYVAGWGNTEECNSQGNVCDTPSHELKYGKTTVIDFNTCYNATQSLKKFQLSRLTADKFCAGDGSESVVQKGDSGGGLTFVFDGLHYVYGVVSVKLKLELNKKTYYSFGAFTNVPLYLDWITSKLY